MLFGRGNIPSKTTVVENHNEAFFVEIYLWKRKYLLFYFEVLIILTELN